MCSFTLGHWIIPFLSILVVQIGTMKCFYCPQKDASVVLWDSLSRDDQIFLRDKYPDAGQGAVCELCVRSARPSVFFSRHSSSTSSSAPQSVGSQVVSGAATSLAISGFWAAGAFRSSSCVWCSHVFGHRVSGSLCAFIFFRQALFVQCCSDWHHEVVFLLLRTSDKVQKTMGPGIEPICGVSVIWPFRSADLLVASGILWSPDLEG